MPCHLKSIFSILLRLTRQRHYWKNMDSDLLTPPAVVRGMRELDRDAFKKRIQVPRLRVPEEKLNKVLPLVKTLLLKMENRRPVCKINAIENESRTFCEILLHPIPVNSWESLPVDPLTQLEVKPTDFYYDELELTYKNWRADEIFKSVLPLNQESFSSYSRIGHIVHLNLRDHLLPYKQVIGQVLLDKSPGCRTVVNKAATIDNTYRNFQLDLICGVPEYKVETKECGVVFEFDFERVYWNPRLSTEHERIVKMLNTGDVLYDVFAGVGPFSIPAARKGCWVLANDLNPESYQWLQHNSKRNKCLRYIQTYNKDGRDFIRQDVKTDLLKRWQAQQSEASNKNSTIHITMNLPAMAVEFLDTFRALLNPEDIIGLNLTATDFKFPIVHVYSFAKGENTKDLVRDAVEKHLGLPLQENLLGIYFVRNVAPNKDMYRISFRLTAEILTTPKIDSVSDTSAGQSEGVKLKRIDGDRTLEAQSVLPTKVKRNE